MPSEAKLNLTSAINRPLDQLIEWYCSHCDGDWEHSWGISITSLDNPGFLVKINLKDTKLEGATFDEVEIEFDGRGGEEWICCSKKDNEWIGACSPRSLERVIEIFNNWSVTAGPDH